MEQLLTKLNLVPYSDSEDEEEEKNEEKVDVGMKDPAPLVISDPQTCRTINESSSSEEESDEESSSSTSSSDFVPEEIPRNKEPRESNSRKIIKREIDPEYLVVLPPIASLNISVNNEELKCTGQVLSIVNLLVVIESNGTQVLDVGTALFVDDKNCIGHIYEIFGPVKKPFYSVRFNNEDDIKKLGLAPSTQIYFAPNRNNLTKYVFMENIKNRGTDASWKDDCEPPPEFADYSDDEKEKLAKSKRKQKYRATGPAVPEEYGASNYPSCSDFEPGKWPAVPHPLSNRVKKDMKRAGRNTSNKPNQFSIYQPNVTWNSQVRDNFRSPFVGPLPFPFSSAFPPPPPPPSRTYSYCGNNFSNESGFINFDGQVNRNPPPS